MALVEPRRSEHVPSEASGTLELVVLVMMTGVVV
jgi:hypothetical protein